MERAGSRPSIPGIAERKATVSSRSDVLFNLIHAYHRIFYKHRGTFHQLGYGHAGKVGPEFVAQSGKVNLKGILQACEDDERRETRSVMWLLSW